MRCVSFVLQDFTVHHHELHLREAAGGDLHCLRHFRGGDTQTTSSLLRGTCKGIDWEGKNCDKVLCL